MAEETEYWKAKLAKFTPKKFKWRENEKMKKEAEDATQELIFRMNQGILLKLKLQRTQEVEKYAIKNCYGKDSGYNYLQAKR